MSPPHPVATAPALTLISRWRARVAADPVLVRTFGWVVPTVLTLFAAWLRLTDLRRPQELAFDETYYVKDAWSLWLLGYEGTWADDANTAFAGGNADAIGAELDPTGAFVVHPPLGKWLIALGMALTGPGSSFGWRLAVAVLGSLTVLVVFLVAKALTRSLLAAGVAGFLLAIDGIAIVMSRIALLDGILVFFLLLGFLFVLYDLRSTLPRLFRESRDLVDPFVGPVLWRRPWLVAAGVALGAACAVKWSGLYALAAFGIYVVVADALVRRRAGVIVWPADAVFRQGVASFVLLVGPATVVYLSSWLGWFLTSGGYDRGIATNPFASLWVYHASILGFHSGLSSSHPYASPAWQWPLLLRPTAVWVDSAGGGCGTDNCIAVISTVPNPLIWYGGVAAAIYLIYRVVRAVVTRTSVKAVEVAPLVGLAATYLPWLFLPERTIFQFYTVAMMPFLVLALMQAFRAMVGRGWASLYRRQSGERTVVVIVVVITLVSAFFYPVWTGMSVPYEFWLMHNWLPGWI